MSQTQDNFTQQWGEYRNRANQQLEEFFTQTQKKQTGALEQAMRYSTQGGGKRFRAMLVYASGHCFGATFEALDCPAAALELIHAYSLIHDDLPAMDDDDTRRGQASCHIQYDEATAILAGDALQTLAFELLAQPNEHASADRTLKMIQVLAQAAGAAGMVGGQALDMLETGKPLGQDALQNIHERKTGALIRAALTIGALAAKSVSKKELALIDQYGRDLGLAFQVVDDILDQTQNSEQLGKPSGADRALGKNTYPALMGLAAAQDYADQLVYSAQQSLGKIERDTTFLGRLTDFTRQRDH